MRIAVERHSDCAWGLLMLKELLTFTTSVVFKEEEER